MREKYSTSINKEEVKILHITKEMLVQLFIDLRTKQPSILRKSHLCMQLCIFHPRRNHWIDRWFMVFDKPPYNNIEVPLHFLCKLWVEFIMGLHVNYFDM
jgi:hypothetical protein